MTAPEPPGSSPARSVAERVRRLREERGWTQAQLARAAALSAATVGRVERGEERPLGRTASALAHSLGVTVDELLGLTGEQPALFASLDERRLALVRRLLAFDDERFGAAEGELIAALERAERGAPRGRRRKGRGAGVDGKSAP